MLSESLNPNALILVLETSRIANLQMPPARAMIWMASTVSSLGLPPASSEFHIIPLLFGFGFNQPQVLPGQQWHWAPGHHCGEEEAEAAVPLGGSSV